MKLEARERTKEKKQRRKEMKEAVRFIPFDNSAFVVCGRFGSLTGLTTPIEWMLSAAILIDCLKSVPQLLCNRTLQRSKIFRLNINTMGFIPV